MRPVQSYARLATLLGGLGAILLAAGLPTSRALASLGVLVLAMAFLARLLGDPPRWGELGRAQQGLLLATTGLTAWMLLAGLWTPELSGWLREMRVYLAFPLVVAGIWASGPWPWRRTRLVFGSFVLAISVVAIWSLVHYAFYQVRIDEAIEQSKSLPILQLDQPPWQYHAHSAYSHIYFSLLNAFAVVAALRLWRKERRARPWLGWGAGLLAVFLFACLHAFTGRTGLVGFYVASAVVGVVSVLRSGHVRKGLFTLLLLAAVPVVAYHTLDSFQERVDLTRRDLTALHEGKDASWWSLGRRWVVWKMAVRSIAGRPIVGHGANQVKTQLNQRYQELEAENNSPIRMDFRLYETHNQYLNTLLDFGLVGGLWLLAVFLAPVLSGRRVSLENWFLVSLLLVSCTFESILERQIGIGFTGLMWGLAWFREQSERRAD